MHLLEVYYEHYAENCNGAYWEEDKQIPYMVLIKDRELIERFKEELIELGFRCVSWNDSYPSVLVNIKLKRFGMITRACYHECVDKRNYSYDEFYNEVLNKKDN